jgi:hypothetical protein
MLFLFFKRRVIGSFKGTVPRDFKLQLEKFGHLWVVELTYRKFFLPVHFKENGSRARKSENRKILNSFTDSIHADWTRLDPYVDCKAVQKLREVRLISL